LREKKPNLKSLSNNDVYLPPNSIEIISFPEENKKPNEILKSIFQPK